MKRTSTNHIHGLLLNSASKFYYVRFTPTNKAMVEYLKLIYLTSFDFPMFFAI